MLTAIDKLPLLSAIDCVADMGIVLDISKSITKPVWEGITVPFVEDILTRLHVGHSNIRVGVVSFNDTA